FGASAGPVTRALMPPVAAALRRWDRRTAAGVHHFVAISRFVADRIRRAYGRVADVIYPPVDVARFRIEESPGEHSLVVSALAPYKRIDLESRPPIDSADGWSWWASVPRSAASGRRRGRTWSSWDGGTTPRWPSYTRAAVRSSSPRSRISASLRSRRWP